MQITLSRKLMKTLLSGFAKAVPRRKTALPVLGHILFTYDGADTVTAGATDLEQTLICTLPEESADGEPGQFLAPLSELRNIRSALRGRDEAVLTPAAVDAVEVRTGTGDAAVTRRIESMPVEEYPVMLPEVPLTGCDTGQLIAAFRKAAVTVSADESRLAMTGVYADPEEKAFVGTDGCRLTLTHPQEFPFTSEAVIPASAVMRKLLPAEPLSGKAGILERDGESVFEIRSGPWRYRCRCIPGRYPAYRQVIPDMNVCPSVRWTFTDADAETLSTALQQFPDTGNGRIFFCGSKNGAAVCARQDSGEFSGIRLPECSSESDDPVGFEVNRSYFLDALSQGFREVRVQDGHSPMLFGSGGDLHVLMPLHPDSNSGQAAEWIRDFLERNRRPETAQEANVTSSGTAGRSSRKSRSGRESKSAGGMKVVEPRSPLEELRDLVRDTRDKVRQANSAVRDISRQVTAVERHYRAREKELRSREKELQKNIQLIEKVQEAVNF